MGDKSNIEWTDATWNPIRGCSRVSAGCEHCYAEQVAKRFSGPGMPYEGLVRIGKDGKPRARWNGTIKLVPEHLGDPLRWRKPRRVFVNSMSDLFHPGVPFEYIAAVFGVMAAAPQHVFQVLTKRPERARAFLDFIDTDEPGRVVHAAVRGCMLAAARVFREDTPRAMRDAMTRPPAWPLSNVWLGVSVEDQASADARIPTLLTLPAAVRWVSYEPAIGPVNFGAIRETLGPGSSATSDVLEYVDPLNKGRHVPPLDWIVIGGESGNGARPFDLAWARSTIAACREAGAPVFVKQLGANACTRIGPVQGSATAQRRFVDDVKRLGDMMDRKGGDPAEWPEDLRVREYPKAVRS